MFVTRRSPDCPQRIVVSNPPIAGDETCVAGFRCREHNAVDWVAGEALGQSAGGDSNLDRERDRLDRGSSESRPKPGADIAVECHTPATLERCELEAACGRDADTVRTLDEAMSLLGQIGVLVLPPEQRVGVQDDHGSCGSQLSHSGAISSSSETR